MRRSSIIKWGGLILLILLTVGMAKDEKGIKKRIAVFSFDDKTEHRVRWWTGQPVGEGMADMLTTSLVKSGSYMVLERQELNQIMAEQNLGQGGDVTPESAAQIGKLLGAELAVFGAVTEFGHSKSSTGGRLKDVGIGVGISNIKATVAVDVRFVNTTTGEIILAENVRRDKSQKGLSVDTREFNFDNKDKFDDSIVGKATREAIDDIVKLIDKEAPNLTWQAKIVKGDGPIYINAGSITGVKVGDKFVVYHQGEELKDPDTGLILGAALTKVGVIKVVDNTIGEGKASQCEAVEGSNFERGDLVREK